VVLVFQQGVGANLFGFQQVETIEASPTYEKAPFHGQLAGCGRRFSVIEDMRRYSYTTLTTVDSTLCKAKMH
jgi:hypothetical protein